MSVIDVLLVGAVLIVALWWIAFPNRARRALRLVPLALLALAVLQIAAEGFYWQLIPAYLLITALGLLSIFSPGAPSGLLALAPPGRWLLSLAIGGGRPPSETQRATVDMLDAFLSGPLNGKPASIEAAAARYKGVADVSAK